MDSCNRVGEIFTAAGAAFTKLGELTTHLHAAQEPNSVGSKWDDEDIQQLREAVKKFGEDLNKVSETIKAKSATQMKVGIKRKVYEDAGLTLIAGAATASPVKKANTNSSGKVTTTITKVITKPAHNNYNSIGGGGEGSAVSS
jgi:hypothetical protein